MKFGALVGGTIGLVLGAIAESKDECTGECSYKGLAVLAGLNFGMLGGAFLGGIAGTQLTTPLWARAGGPTGRPSFSSWDLMPGDGVRVARDPRLTGVVIEGTGDSAIIRFETGNERTVPISELERYVGERRDMGKGLLLGGAAGLVYGLVEVLSGTTSNATTSATVGGIAFAAAVGGFIGSLVTGRLRPVWELVDRREAQPLSLTPTVAPGRVGLAARLAF